MYADSLRQDEEAKRKPYWANTSSNSIVRELVEHAEKLWNFLFLRGI